MFRSRAVLALCLATGMAGLASAAEVAVLKSSEVAAWRPALDALKRSAASHNVTEYDLRGDRVEADRIVAQLKASRAILVAVGPLAAQAARAGAPELPLVFCMVQDPGAIGLVDAPNTWGVAFSIPARNQLAAYRAVNPRAVRIGAIHSADGAKVVADAQKAAPVLRLQILMKIVASEREVPEALRALLKDNMDALWIPPDPLLLSDATRRFLLSETLKAGKPVYSFSVALVPEGALVSDGPGIASIGTQAAELVNRVASGEKGEYEVLFPTAELVINKKIADKLGITIPAEALASAQKVF